MADVFKTYEEAVEWLFFELPRSSNEIFKGEEGLEKMRIILETFDNPQDDYSTVHIAGTSGKGTTAKLITDMLVINGKKVGTIMSPHVYDLRERFLVDGQFVKKTEVKAALEVLRAEFLDLNSRGVYPTYFEATLVLAYEVFKRHKIDYLVVETGLGGLLDGTNLVSRRDKLAVITQIGLDHTEILGNTLEEVAAQKAGIITEGIEVIALRQKDSVNKAIQTVATTKGTALQLIQPAEQISGGPGMSGEHQKSNIALSKAAVETLARRDHWTIKDDTAATAVQGFSLPGRFERKRLEDKEIILDGAHNSQKLTALVSAVGQLYSDEKFSIVFGASRSRNWRELLEILRPVSSEFVFTTYSARKSDMKRAAQDFAGETVEGIKTTVLNDSGAVLDYMRSSESNKWLVTGSFYVVSEIGQLLS